MKNQVETFFDNLAYSWDQMENCPKEIKLSLLSELGIQPGDKVLDVACGTGVVTGHIHSFSNAPVLGIDISANMIECAKDKFKGVDWASFIHQDLLMWDTDEKFDKVVIYNAYPHFLDPKSLSKKLASILKPNGKVAILHSLSREQLTAHHSGRAEAVSRVLLEPSRETEFFKGEFNALTAKENDCSIVIILEKK